jgi:predicted nucleotidyltransferase
MHDVHVKPGRRVLGDALRPARHEAAGRRATEDERTHGVSLIVRAQMRVRGFLWRTAGRAAGRAAPRPVRAYHEAVTRSLVRALLRDPDVVAVYAQGSYAAGELRPGRSDVDLVAVVADSDVEGELAQLARLRRPYRRHQAVLPIDLAVLGRSGFATAAGRLAQRRGRMRAPGPMVPVAAWRLLGGDDLRTGAETTPAGDWYVTESHVARAVRAAATGGDVRAALRHLIHDVRRERLRWPSAQRLLTAAGDAELIAAALELTDAQRDVVPVAAAQRAVPGWTAPPAPAAVPRLDVPGPATLHHPPFAPRPELIVEGEPLVLARWAVDGGAAAAARAGVDLRIATPRLAQEGWRGGMRAASILLASIPVDGPPLAQRLCLPAGDVLREQAATQAQGFLLAARAALLGHRGTRRDPLLPARLAAWRVLADGGPLLGEERSLRAAVPALAEPDWARSALTVAR